MRFSHFVFLILGVFSCTLKHADERNAAYIKARADSLATADSIATEDSIRQVLIERYSQLDDPGTDLDNSTGTVSLELIDDSVRVVGRGVEILKFRFPNGQVLGDGSDNKAEGYLELSPEQEAVVSSVRFSFTIRGSKCDDAPISDALGADPDTTYLKTIRNNEFKVSEVGLGGRNPTNYTLYQFTHNEMCLSFTMEAVEVPDVIANPHITYDSINAIFENLLGSLKMKEVLN